MHDPIAVRQKLAVIAGDPRAHFRAKLAAIACETPSSSEKSTAPRAPMSRELKAPAQSKDTDWSKVSAADVEIAKLAGMMQATGRAMGALGKAVGFLPTGIGNVAGGAIGALGGALTAPPGKRLAGAAAGATAGLPGAAGFVAPALAGRALGV